MKDADVHRQRSETSSFGSVAAVCIFNLFKHWKISIHGI
jgi:hypothetical protein